MNITQVWKQQPEAGGDISWNNVLTHESSETYHAQAA